MLECKICGCKFNAVEERHYISRDNGKSGLAVAFGSEPEEKLYDTFDCPSCGCQIVKFLFIFSVFYENFGFIVFSYLY